LLALCTYGRLLLTCSWPSCIGLSVSAWKKSGLDVSGACRSSAQRLRTAATRNTHQKAVASSRIPTCWHHACWLL
jgi:hypothetical protein